MGPGLVERDRERAFAELSRYCRPQGVILVVLNPASCAPGPSVHRAGRSALTRANQVNS